MDRPATTTTLLAPDALQDLQAARRNVSPRRLHAPGPDQAGLHRIVAAAAHAPDHGRLRPWRFVLIGSASLAGLGAAFEAALLEREPDCDAERRARARERAFHAPCLLAAILADEPPLGAASRAEKLVSLGCALQNMLLAAQAMGYAGGLASGGAMDSTPVRALLRLAPHEQAICFLAFGSADAPAPRARPQPGDYFSVL
jgi:nitroreductase